MNYLRLCTLKNHGSEPSNKKNILINLSFIKIYSNFFIFVRKILKYAKTTHKRKYTMTIGAGGQK